MTNYKTFLPLLLGLVPILAGRIMDFLVLNFSVFPSFTILPIAFAALWYYLGFRSKKLTGKAWLAVLLLNTPALIDLILVGIQEVQGAYWSNIIGGWSQLFFLPLLVWGLRISNLIIGTYVLRLFPGYCAAFLIMLILSILGTRHQEKTTRGF